MAPLLNVENSLNSNNSWPLIIIGSVSCIFLAIISAVICACCKASRSRTTKSKAKHDLAACAENGGSQTYAGSSGEQEGRISDTKTASASLVQKGEKESNHPKPKPIVEQKAENNYRTLDAASNGVVARKTVMATPKKAFPESKTPAKIYRYLELPPLSNPKPRVKLVSKSAIPLKKASLETVDRFDSRYRTMYGVEANFGSVESSKPKTRTPVTRTPTTNESAASPPQYIIVSASEVAKIGKKIVQEKPPRKPKKKRESVDRKQKERVDEKKRRDSKAKKRAKSYFYR